MDDLIQELFNTAALIADEKNFKGCLLFFIIGILLIIGIYFIS